MGMPKIKRLAHIVLFVRDPEASASWYCDILGMHITARAGGGPYAGGIFLSFGESDHDIALFRGDPDASRGREFEHIGLELDCRGDFDQLRRVYGRMLSKNVHIQEILDHGISVGIYFLDPDGHQLEVFAQVIPSEGGAATLELGRNEGQADPIELQPLVD